MSSPVIALPLPAAAKSLGVSPALLRKAIQTTSPESFPPPLRAKKNSRGHYLIKVSELERWFDSLPEA